MCSLYERIRWLSSVKSGESSRRLTLVEMGPFEKERKMSEPFGIEKEFTDGALTKPLPPDSRLWWLRNASSAAGGLSHAEGAACEVNVLKKGW